MHFGAWVRGHGPAGHDACGACSADGQVLAPECHKRGFEARSAVDDHEPGPLQPARIEIGGAVLTLPFGRSPADYAALEFSPTSRHDLHCSAMAVRMSVEMAMAPSDEQPGRKQNDDRADRGFGQALHPLRQGAAEQNEG